MASFEIAVGALVVDDAVHNEVDESGLGAGFSDLIAGDELLGQELLEIFRVEVVIPILQEAMKLDGIFVKEFRDLCFKMNRQHLQEKSHFLILLNFDRLL